MHEVLRSSEKDHTIEQEKRESKWDIEDNIERRDEDEGSKQILNEGIVYWGKRMNKRATEKKINWLIIDV